jgi:hypothetical protein
MEDEVLKLARELQSEVEKITAEIGPEQLTARPRSRRSACA